MLPKVEIPKDTNKLKQQIKALEYQLQHDTKEKDIKIHKATLKKLSEALLFQQYLEMQSKEWREDIINYESFKEPGRDIAIKVNFTWGWLRIYRTKSGQIEWY